MGYADSDFQELLAAFTFRRAELVRVLRRLTANDWERVGQHETHGRLTLLELLRHLADHEVEHCEQIEAILK